MEVYAAMVDRMDQGIGRIVAELKRQEMFDNTLIFFLQDNGGCAEGMGRGGAIRRRADAPSLPPMDPAALQPSMIPRQTRDGWPMLQGKGVMPGPADTYHGYGRGWANVSNTPFREYKHWVHEGGIATPLIAHWPEGIRRCGELEHQPSHLIATDVVMQSLFADPSQLLGVDETLERLARVLPDVDTPALRDQLANRKRRFVWIRRALSPATAQQVLDLGLPGLAFRSEPRRSYPQGRLAGHLIGNVNVDNKGLSGIESHIDQIGGVERVVGEPRLSGREIRLTIDLGVQAAVEQELRQAIDDFDAKAASAVVLDVRTGAVRAAASLPGVDPADPVTAQDPANMDRLRNGTYELGSIFKALTVALAFEKKTVTPETVIDVRQPITIGRHEISDFHAAGRPLSVEEVFIHSSNVGAGMIALDLGAEAQRDFLARLGLLEPLKTEAGATAAPQVPKHWERPRSRRSRSVMGWPSRRCISRAPARYS